MCVATPTDVQFTILFIKKIDPPELQSNFVEYKIN